VVKVNSAHERSVFEREECRRNAMNQCPMPEQSAAYMFIILDNIHEYGTEFPYCNPKNYQNHGGEHYMSSPQSRLSEPRGDPLHYSTKTRKIESHGGWSQTWARHRIRSQPIRPENSIQSATCPIMTEGVVYPEPCLHHSTFIAQYVVADFSEVGIAHEATAQLGLSPSTTNGSPHELS
jgi:hypothetical protein